MSHIARNAIVGRYPLAICTACILHFVWAVGILADPSAINATATHALLLISGTPPLASIILVFVAGLAAIGVTGDDPHWRVLLALPQQFVLVMSSYGCIEAMYLSQFADGIVRERWFLVVDQLPMVLMTLGHTMSLILIARTAHRRCLTKIA